MGFNSKQYVPIPKNSSIMIAPKTSSRNVAWLFILMWNSNAVCWIFEENNRIDEN